MTRPQTVRVMDALEAAGGGARFVGGCVRNTLMDRPVDDVDVATTLTPDRVIAALDAAGIRAVPTGVEHGTVTAVCDHVPFEITTLRRDVETDGRRAVVAFTTDWAEDAARRDFRLNALYADREGRVYDPVGGGLEDAAAGRVVFVGDAETRIREDYLRVLRFFRFLAWYGDPARGADATGLAACARLKDGIATLSAERVSKELLKLLAASDPRRAVDLMAETGVLAAALPGALRPERFRAAVALTDDPVLRLSALLEDEAAAVRARAEALRLSNAQRDRLLAALPDGVAVDPAMDERAARAALYRLGAQAFADRLTRAAAETGGDPERLRAWMQAWTPPRFPLRGPDAAAAGVAPGPETGRLLRAVEDWWVENDFPDAEAARAEMKRRSSPA